MSRPLFWHQGLFLQPQHFQLFERGQLAALAPLYRYAQPHLWGVAHSEINAAALGGRNLQVAAGEFVFADMTPVALPANARLKARPLPEDWVEGGGPLKVFLGLKKWNPDGENVTVVTGLDQVDTVTTRFMTTTETEDAADLHQGGPQAQVRHLWYALRLFWESELPALGDYELIELAQLVMTGGSVGLEERFVPPALGLGASRPLDRIVREIRDQIAARARQLEEYKRDRGIQNAGFGTRDMVYLLALRSLNRFVPLLYQLTETADIHPWQVYGVLRQLAGELSTFSSEVGVLGDAPGGEPLPAYDHTGLWECFTRAQGLITGLLDMITAGPEYVMELLFDGTYFSADLPPAIFEGANRFYLVLETAAEPAQVIQALGGIAKLSSREALPLLIVRALPGIGLAHLEAPPQELPRRAGSIYFQIDQHHEQWDQARAAGNLALYWETAPEDLKAELMVVERS